MSVGVTSREGKARQGKGRERREEKRSEGALAAEKISGATTANNRGNCQLSVC